MRYKVVFQCEDDQGKLKIDEFTHNGKGFTYDNADRLRKILRGCGHKRVIVRAI